ncbi:hypothetical protein PHMEG_00038807 [Phytophthora megakarya]|uniref:Uncharacterized protein n=1 Tax=Phytophthora megakarya TaxID=4795 RepID=A0A225UGS8_9STRA|nr:hypothetical protein PHMEG_00038807 [Phytophthora megakarya]
MVTTLGTEKVLRKFDATRKTPTSYHHNTLLPLVVKTRELLNDAFLSRFFSSYNGREVMKACSYVWEIQMLLHPHVKNPDDSLMEMVKTCEKLRRLEDDVIERNQSIVKSTVKQKLRAIMRDLTPPRLQQGDVDSQRTQVVHANPCTEDVSEFFTNIQAKVPVASSPQLLHEDVIDTELARLFRDSSLPQPVEDGRSPQHIGFYQVLLELFSRVLHHRLKLSATLPNGDRVVPLSITGKHRHVLILASKPGFVDVTQCPQLTAEETCDAVPLNVRVN